MKTPKQKLKPSWEVHDRILWDPKLNALAFYIGYEDRMIKDALGEKPLIDWASNDIPWNRVQYIRCADAIVWDRAKRIDLFEDDQLPLEAFATKMQPTQQVVLIDGINIVPKPTFIVTHQEKSIFSNIESCIVDSLKLVTFNLLTDKYHTEFTQSDLRHNAIVQHLLQLEADIILLQEVDKPMLDRLLNANWKQPIYSSDIKRTTGTYYQELVILSKYPFSWVEFQYDNNKKFPIASWKINGQDFHVANVHLSSNRSTNALTIRKKQLDTLSKYLKRLSGNILIGGDFNCRGGEGVKILTTQEFVDGWLVANPNQEGYTFEPDNNPLAKASTLTGLPARFDRFFIRSAQQANWKVKESTIFANNALEEYSEIFPSDHYGLSLQLQVPTNLPESEIPTSSWTSTLATYKSAIVIIPDENTVEKIQTIRQQFDKKYNRWMPHLTLVYGFLPDRYFDEVAQELSDLLKAIPLFELSLKRYQFFSQKSETTAWLEPVEISSKGVLQQLQVLLQEAFVMKNTKNETKQSFTPHLSIGQFRSSVQALSLLPSWKETNFKVQKIALISRQNKEAFKIRYTIELESGRIEKNNHSKENEQKLIAFLKTKQAIISLAEQQNRSTVLDVIKDTCTSILGQEYYFKPIGSTALGTNTSSSDLDVLIAIPKEVDTHFFLETLLYKLEGWYESARLIQDAQVPILKLQMDGIFIDLLCVAYPSSFITMNDLSEQHRRYFSPQDWQAVTGVLEAESILNYIQPWITLDSFQWFVKTIKTWATIRVIKGNAFGFLGSYSWTILAASVLQQIPSDEDREDLTTLMSYFFNSFKQYDWSSSISIVEKHQYKLRGKQDQFPILTSIKPYYNSARNVTYSTLSILKQELERGASILSKLKKGKSSWKTLFDPLNISNTPTLILTIQAERKKELEEACGWIEGHIVSLIITLEKIDSLTVRPYPIIKLEVDKATIKLGLIYADKHLLESLIQVSLQDFIVSFDFDNKHQQLTITCDA